MLRHKRHCGAQGGHSLAKESADHLAVQSWLVVDVQYAQAEVKGSCEEVVSVWVDVVVAEHVYWDLCRLWVSAVMPRLWQQLATK